MYKYKKNISKDGSLMWPKLPIVWSKIYNIDWDRYNQYLNSIHSNLEAGNIFDDKLIGFYLRSLFNTPVIFILNYLDLEVWPINIGYDG